MFRIYAFFIFLLGSCHLGGHAMVWGPERGGDQCETAVQETILEDRATIVDNSPSRLHHTWLSQECEVRAGPDYLIRRYTFYGNGSFLLLRHHYAEESCSVATHTVTARGFIKLLTPSVTIPGATEAKYQLNTVHVIPLNRQVAHKFGHRLNLTCEPQPRWRPYIAQLIYEQPQQRYTNIWYGPRYNSLQSKPLLRNPHGIDCLETLSIDFEELKILRVHKRTSLSRAFALGTEHKPRVELLLGSLPPNPRMRWNHRSTSLQSISLIRANTVSGCPVCSSILRGTEYSPPLLHEVAALPALLGGSWLSMSCESVEGGLWLRRQFQVYSGDRLWTGRWDYHADPRCSVFLYAITAAGSYVQRAGRQRRHGELDSSVPTYHFGTSGSRKRRGLLSNSSERRSQRSTDQSVYKHILEHAQPSMAESFAAILRGNQRREETTRKPYGLSTPSGTTELDLHVAESLLILADQTMTMNCGGRRGVRMTTWPRNCIPKDIEAPSTLGLKARLGVNWIGQYTLLLGQRDDNLWEAPLRQCGPTSSHNPTLRAHLRRSVGLKFGLFSSSSTWTSINSLAIILSQQLLFRIFHQLF